VSLVCLKTYIWFKNSNADVFYHFAKLLEQLFLNLIKTSRKVNKKHFFCDQFLLFALRHLYNPSDYLRLPSYENRLKIINLESLQSRRENLSAVFKFNILHNRVNSAVLKNNVKINNNQSDKNITIFT
jgi:hypothetical protein